MAKYKVVKEFRDVHTKEVYAVGRVIELTVKRANEVNKNLKGFIEPVAKETKEGKK